MSIWLIIFFSVGITVLLGTFSVYYGRAATARRSAYFLARVHSGDKSDTVDLLGNNPARLSKMPQLQRLLLDVPGTPQMAELLEQSGLATTVAMLMTQIGIVGALALMAAAHFGLNPFPAAFMAFIGGVLPVFYVYRARTIRAARFEAQLPQVLELIGLYLRSGRSLPQAFIGATEEILPPASEEFSVCAEEYRLGRPLEQSLKRLAMKYPTSIGFRLFAIAVSVLGQTGGNLVEVLERIKRTLDAGITYGLRLRSLTGESRMSALILSALPGIFMCGTGIFNPQYFSSFFDNSLGRILFGVFLSFWGMGLLWIRQLMKSKMV